MEGGNGFPGWGKSTLQIPSHDPAVGILLILLKVKEAGFEAAVLAALRKPSDYLLSTVKGKAARWGPGEDGAERERER